jgi:uncharacterized membrane protein
MGCVHAGSFGRQHGFVDSVRYRRFTLTWALFGLCAMLLLNFVVPHLVGSIASIWFFLSTLAGAALAHGLRLKTPGQPGRITPVWGIAVGLLLAYWVDAIPPVPLVTRAVAVGHALERTAGEYRLQQEAASRLFEPGKPLMVCKTVLLELEWVMPGYYGFSVAEISTALNHLLFKPQVVRP